MNVLEIRDLHKRFGSTRALRGVDLEVQPETIFGFLGPNGAGKSTTIRAVMDFIRPDSGRIDVFGKDAHTHATELKRLVAYVPAEPNLSGDWTVDEHIRFVARVRGVKPQTAAKFKSDLDLNGQPKVRHLSTGNQQKLAIVMALMSVPKLLILDEPTRGLDPLLQAAFHTLLRDYAASGGTVFLSSHNLAEVDQLCSRAAIIKDGRIITAVSMTELKRKSLYNVHVTFSGGVPNLAKLAPVGLTVIGNTVDFQVRGDINLVLHELGKHMVQGLEITRGTLEDMFLELYK